MYILLNDVLSNNSSCVETSFILFPHLSVDLVLYSYEQITNRPDMSIEHIGQRSGFRFFFYKVNNKVYYVVSNEDFDQIYHAEIFQDYLTLTNDKRK